MNTKNKINLPQLANAIQAYNSCIATNKNEMADIWLQAIESAQIILPQGGGFDGKMEFDIAKSTQNKVIVNFEFHHMRDGYYIGWCDYKLVLRPSFIHGIDFLVKGRDIDFCKDYFYDVFHSVFTL